MRNRKGQVLVETAIILPFLLVLIFGLVDFGRIVYTKDTLNTAARSGARVAAVTPALTPVSPASLFSSSGEPADTMKNYIFHGIPRDGSIQYEVRIRDAAGTPVPGPANTGNQIQVIVTWPNFQLITPLYYILALLTNSTRQESTALTITGEASMRYE
ncbi:MAG TPA: hypothetical protein DDY22_11170 [Geobacter sp.]|nr:hypothetical protein [Geobacter sp.]